MVKFCSLLCEVVGENSRLSFVTFFWKSSTTFLVVGGQGATATYNRSPFHNEKPSSLKKLDSISKQHLRISSLNLRP